MDIVWDIYIDNSLKSHTRKERVKGTRRRVSADTMLPANWHSFLRCDSNKTELFGFLAEYIADMQSEKLVITTNGPSVLANQDLDESFSSLQPCHHEEADTRIILHLAQGSSKHKKAMIKTVDTDVVVLAVTAVVNHGLEELWVAFGTGVNLRYIPAHQLASTIGPAKSQSLPIFHSLTGCDTVSSFHNIGKKKLGRCGKCSQMLPTAS